MASYWPAKQNSKNTTIKWDTNTSVILIKSIQKTALARKAFIFVQIVTHHPASMRSVSMPIANDDQETFKDIRPTNVGIHAPKSEKGTSSTPAKAETMTRVST